MKVMFALLARREAGPSGAAVLLAVAVIAGLAAVAAARMLALDPSAPPRGGGAIAITRFDVTACIVLAVFAAIRLTARPAEDHASGWLHAQVGNGGSRAVYLGALFLAVAGTAIVAFTVCLVAFAMGTLIAGGGTGTASRAPEMWLTGSLLIASFAAYGLAAGVLIKEGGAALTTAIVAFALPFAVAVAYVLATDNRLPPWFRVAGFAHLPPLGLDVSPALLLHHLVYLGVATLLGSTLATRLVGRW